MRDIPGYEGLYAATSCGRIYGYKRKKFLKPFKNKFGYMRVNLSQNGDVTQHMLHRLILQTYSPIEDADVLDVNHKDENKEHNYINNLEWIVHKDNCNYGTRNERIAKGNRDTRASSK